MSHPWFFVATLPQPGSRCALPDDEARHARGARRLREGDEVVAFDGAGGRAPAVVRHVDRRHVEIEVGECETEPTPSPVIHLATAWPKGDRASTLLGMATQLGVDEITPLACTHSVTIPGASQRERFGRVMREACKQSERARVPTLSAPAEPTEVVAAAPSETRVVLLDPSGANAADWLVAERESPPDPVLLLVGPEAGFSEDEREALIAAGATPLRTADTILRIETAAVAGLTVAALLRRAPRDPAR